MQPTQTIQQEKEPVIQLLIVASFAIIGILVISAIAALIVYGLYGLDALKGLLGLTEVTGSSVAGLKIFLTAQQIGLFLLPAFLLAVTEGKRPQHFYGMKMPNANLLFLVFLIMVCSTPMMGFVNELNQKMILPDFLKGVEEWMRRLEDEGIKTTEAILKMSTVGSFLINFLVIAIIPAICEEFIFRGALQRTFLRMIKNPHVAIWTSAFIFSAIHFQFFGFFPRLFLGAAFGYIYFWTGSIWYAVFAHFLNNGYAVIVTWYLQKQNLPINQNDNINVAWYGYVISAILTIALFKLLKDKATSADKPL